MRPFSCNPVRAGVCMSVAAAIKRMIDLGVPPADAVEIAEMIEHAFSRPVPAYEPSFALTPPDAQVDKKAATRRDFETFWAEYPRKVGKGDAMKAYARAFQRIGAVNAPPKVILDNLRRLSAGWRQKDPEKIPHPATWLNRDGWEDETEAPAKGDGIALNGHNHYAPSSGASPEELEARRAMLTNMVERGDA